LRNKSGDKIGVYPLNPIDFSLVIDDNNELWVRFKLKDNATTAEKLSDVGILTRYQFKSEFFGDSNEALDETMQLISIQRQGIEEYTKNANSYRFWAKASNFSMASDLASERQRFDVENFQKKNGGGILLFPNTYNDIHQMSAQSFSIDTEEMKLIDRNVYDYFGVNEEVIQNKSHGDEFAAFYEGAIEPLAVQLSQVMTRMLFSDRQMAFAAGIYFTSNRIQYMNNSDKLSVSRDLVDRAILSINEARDIWQLPPIPGGDRHILRGEYYDAATGTKMVEIGDSE
jgi:hypothetical protein